jgi:hypothetical protein
MEKKRRGQLFYARTKIAGRISLGPLNEESVPVSLVPEPHTHDLACSAKIEASLFMASTISLVRRASSLHVVSSRPRTPVCTTASASTRDTSRCTVLSPDIKWITSVSPFLCLPRLQNNLRLLTTLSRSFCCEFTAGLIAFGQNCVPELFKVSNRVIVSGSSEY